MSGHQQKTGEAGISTTKGNQAEQKMLNVGNSLVLLDLRKSLSRHIYSKSDIIITVTSSLPFPLPAIRRPSSNGNSLSLLSHHTQFALPLLLFGLSFGTRTTFMESNLSMEKLHDSISVWRKPVFLMRSTLSSSKVLLKV